MKKPIGKFYYTLLYHSNNFPRRNRINLYTFLPRRRGYRNLFLIWEFWGLELGVRVGFGFCFWLGGGYMVGEGCLVQCCEVVLEWLVAVLRFCADILFCYCFCRY